MSRNPPDRDVLDRIGGPNSVTWPGFWILLVVSGLVSTASALTTGPGPAWIGVVVSLVAVSTAFAVLGLARVTLLRDVGRRPRPWRTLACFLLASLVATAVSGAVGGVLAAATTTASAAADPLPPAVVLLAVTGTLVGAVVVLAMAAVAVDSWREYRTVADELQALQRRSEEVYAATTADLQRQDDGIRAQVEQVLLAEIDALGAGDTEAAAERLRRAALDVIRPLSHDLGLRTPTVPRPDPAPPSVDLAQLVRDATATRLFAPWVSAAVVTVPVLFSGLLSAAPATSLLLAGITCAEMAGLAWIANTAFAPRAPRSGVATGLLVLLGSTALIGLAVWLTWLALDAAAALGIAWTVLIWIVPVILLLPATGSALRGVRVRQERTRVTLQQDVEWQLARSRALVWLRQSALASALHGPVQSALLAAALHLEAAAEAGEVTAETIGEARQSLDAAMSACGSDLARPVDLSVVFARLQAMWSGISEVTVTPDDGVLDLLTADPVCTHAVADIVTEGCSNAVRHGHAQRITVRLGRVGVDRVRVTLTDDGHPAPPAGHGLGSRLLDAVSLSWIRTTDADGTRLSVLLPARTPVG